jgi:hypothetical protein
VSRFFYIIFKRKYELTKSANVSQNSDLLAPMRRPSFELSKAALVTNLKADVRTPDAAKPAMKD